MKPEPSLFYVHRRFIQIGAVFGVAPYWPKKDRVVSSGHAEVMSLIICVINLVTLYRIGMNTFNREVYGNKPFGYQFILDTISFLAYSSGCFIVGGIFFTRRQLISHMNILSNHPVLTKNYQFQRGQIKTFKRVVFIVLVNLLLCLISGTSFDNHFRDFWDVTLAIPLLTATGLTVIQFLISMQVIHLGYGRIQYEIRRGKLTVENLRQLALLDINLKDFASVVEVAYTPFCCVFISLSFLYVLTIELYVAEGGFTFSKALLSYVTVLPPLVFFVAFIQRSSGLTSKVEETLGCLHNAALDDFDPLLRETIEIFSLQLLNRKLKFKAGGVLPLDFTLVYSMLASVTTYVVTLVQFQAAFYPKTT